MRKILLIILVTAGFRGGAQTPVDTILARVERNNTTLAALRKKVEAEKTGNLTGIYPANPEVEFNYLWGNPAVIGKRKDFAVTQSFEFPTVYGFRKRIANLKNLQADLEYQNHRREILSEARLLCVEIIHQNVLRTEYSRRLENARQIAGVYERRAERGEASLLEFNLAQVHQLDHIKELENLEIERAELLDQLARLNGGKLLLLNDTIQNLPLLPEEFGEWYALAEQNNPMLQWLSQEQEIARREISLRQAHNLPGFHAGYMSEKVAGEAFQGVAMGITIPLWENKNSVREAKAQSMAVEEWQTDARIQFFNEMKTLHGKALALRKSVSSYRSGLKQFDNSGLLNKALSKGEISLDEYFVGLSLYYESVSKLLEMERTMNRTRAELERYM